MNILSTVLKHCATGLDGVTFDFVRVGGMLAIVGHIGVTIAHFVVHGIFEPTAFGIGAGAILSAAGAGVGLKAKTEPGNIIG